MVRKSRRSLLSLTAAILGSAVLSAAGPVLVSAAGPVVNGIRWIA